MDHLIIMLEKDDVRYEYYLYGIKTSNVDPTICKYEVRERRVRRLIGGSTEATNTVYDDVINRINHLICTGFHEVTFKTRSFA